jgi:hypothetical protein
LSFDLVPALQTKPFTVSDIIAVKQPDLQCVRVDTNATAVE